MGLYREVGEARALPPVANFPKAPAKSTKKLDLWRVPQALIVHLKRFPQAEKVRTFVNYPDALDLSEWLVGPPPTEGCLYQLCAVVCHHGSTSCSGHYTTEALVDGTWFGFSDEKVAPLATFIPRQTHTCCFTKGSM